MSNLLVAVRLARDVWLAAAAGAEVQIAALHVSTRDATESGEPVHSVQAGVMRGVEIRALPPLSRN